MRSKWMLRTTNANLREVGKKVGVNPLIAKIMINRQINTIDEMKKFINPSLDNLYDPFLMKGMDEGTEIIKNAILQNEKIMIYGDYDADGVTSTVILYKALTTCDAEASYYIPDRENEGYGLSTSRLEKMYDEGYRTIITCDNGISAVEQVKRAKELGMTIVITDHHELPFEEQENGERIYKTPNADVVINPKQEDCEYPFKQLCGAGIAFKFAEGLYRKMNISEKKAYELIEIAGIGTICDVVDLVDENRVIAKNALNRLKDTDNLGICALKDALNIKGEVSSYHIGFLIGPCINATGRLETAFLSVDLFLAEDENKAKELASTLVDLNKKRQELTNEAVEEVIEMIESSNLINDKVLVVYNEKIHESIAGIVAGRIKERYNLPTIVLTKGKEMPKGSARSIPEFNMFEELIKCKEYLEKFGGHPMAAGLSIKEENIDKFRKYINDCCTLTEDDLIYKIRIDERLEFKNIDFKLIDEIKVLEPFGKGNASPVLAEKNVAVEKISILGENKNTLKLRCRINGTNRYIDGICFNKVDEFIEEMKEAYGESYEYMLENPCGMKMDLIFTPSINEYNGNVSIQLKINSFKIK
ncbi:single-stranded-DNA-specific exonuclease RecJ [Clostridium ihumii]|uniref:single-stranded-DNA-specific exonuclease RecJ n=1 Tax=Clostridium ihumii TaxID=1470356 RepID=UPI000ABF4E38|nr:single-stranded-DNA-specific exonuclease RecJ [Clostridium ihumii]